MENFFEKKFSPNPFQKTSIWERDKYSMVEGV